MRPRAAVLARAVTWFDTRTAQDLEREPVRMRAAIAPAPPMGDRRS